VPLEQLSEEDELRVLRDQVHHATVTDLPPVIDVATWQSSSAAVRSVYVAPSVSAYALALVRATRHHPQIVHGASSRAAISFVRSAQAWAIVSGREYVVPEDLQMIVRPALAHRVVSADGAAAALDDIVARTSVPLGS
jgi:MoxR-like ATPase